MRFLTDCQDVMALISQVPSPGALVLLKMQFCEKILTCKIKETEMKGMMRVRDKKVDKGQETKK